MAIPILSKMLGVGAHAGRRQEVLEERRMAEQAAQQQRGQDVRSQLVGAGFGGMMGPRAGVDPMQQQRLGGIADGLMSPDPNVQAEARSQMGAMQGAMGMDMTPQQRLQYDIDSENLIQERMQTQKDSIDLQRLQSGQMPMNEVINLAGELSANADKQLAPFQAKFDAYDSLVSVMQYDSGPAAFSALFQFVKSQDDSAVRDGESGLLMGASGPMREFQNLFNKAMGRGFFDETTKNEILQAAEAVVAPQQQAAQELYNRHNERIAAFTREYLLPGSFSAIAQGTVYDPNREAITVREIQGRNVPPGQEGAGNTITTPDGETYTISE